MKRLFLKYFCYYRLLLWLSIVFWGTLTYAGELPPLGGGKAIDNAGNFISTNASFAGGASLDGISYQSPLQAIPSDAIKVRGRITVDPADVGKLADLLYVVGIERSAPFDAGVDTQYFAVDGAGIYSPLDLYHEAKVWMTQLAETPFERGVTLQSEMVMDVAGRLFEYPNFSYSFIGYRLQEGTVVYTAVPILVSTIAALADAGELPLLGGGKAIDNAGKFINTNASFAGGASLDGISYQSPLQATPSGAIKVRGRIAVDPADVGKLADLLYVVGIERSAPFDAGVDTQYFAVDGAGIYSPLDLYNEAKVWMTQLAETPFERGVTLQSEMVMDVAGRLFEYPNFSYSFIGYRLQEGTVVYTAVPILVSTIAQIADAEAEIYAKLSDLIETTMSQSKVPGVAVAVIRGKETTFAKGFGLRDVARNLPATADTLFHIGSTHKSMTVMMIGTVIDEGKLTWDTKAVAIYPQFKLSNDQSTQNVTMRHLLNMTSGIPASAEDNFDLSQQPEDLFSYMATEDLAGQPGQVYDYSNISYALAGYLGVLAHDKNTFGQLMAGYQELFKAKIIVPIGMTNAVIKVSEAQANPNYGKAYRVQNGQVTEAVLEDDDNDPWAPAGSLKASVTDMARYISTQLNNGVAPNGNRIVSEATLIESRKPYLEDYALAWEVLTTNGVTHYIHEGDVDDYLSVVGFVPSLNMGYVVFTNSTDAGGAVIGAVPPFLVTEFSALPPPSMVPRGRDR